MKGATVKTTDIGIGSYLFEPMEGYRPEDNKDGYVNLGQVFVSCVERIYEMDGETYIVTYDGDDFNANLLGTVYFRSLEEMAEWYEANVAGKNLNDRVEQNIFECSQGEDFDWDRYQTLCDEADRWDMNE